MQEVLWSPLTLEYARASQAALQARERHLERPHSSGARDVTQVYELIVHHDGSLRDLRRFKVGARVGELLHG